MHPGRTLMHGIVAVLQLDGTGCTGNYKVRDNPERKAMTKTEIKLFNCQTRFKKQS